MEIVCPVCTHPNYRKRNPTATRCWACRGNGKLVRLTLDDWMLLVAYAQDEAPDSTPDEKGACDD